MSKVAAGYLRFPLVGDYIGNWLVAGPVPVVRDAAPQSPDTLAAPAEPGTPDSVAFTVDGTRTAWGVSRGGEDGVVDVSIAALASGRSRAWAYAELVCRSPGTVELVVEASGPATVWLGNHLCANITPPDDSETSRHTVVLRPHLERGATNVHLEVRRETAGPAALWWRVRVRPERAPGAKDSRHLHVRLPTLIDNRARRRVLEEAFASASLERDQVAGDLPVIVRWPSGTGGFVGAHIRVLGAGDAIVRLADITIAPGSAIDLGTAHDYPAGAYRVRLMALPDEVYRDHLRVFRELTFVSLGSASYPATMPAPARRQAVLDLAATGACPIAAALGRLARQQVPDASTWAAVSNWLESATALAHGLAGGRGHRQFALLHAFLGRVAAVAVPPAFSHRLRDTTGAWQHALAGTATTEGEQVLAWTVACLADSDRAERSPFRAALTAWLETFGRYGMTDVNCPEAFGDLATAFAALCTPATDQDLFERAAVALDKLLFLLAVHSTHGVLAGARRAADPARLFGGWRDSTTALAYLLWGQGTLNEEVAPVLALATSDYELPSIIGALATDLPAERWWQERHAPPGQTPLRCLHFSAAHAVLSSSQDDAMGTSGDSEVVWRATLGPDAVAWGNQPGSSSLTDARAPGYWHGNGRRPRVAQWHGTVITLHRIDSADVMAYSHVYLAPAHFSEVIHHDGWLLARRGPAFLALTCTGGIVPVSAGPFAGREWRATAPEHAWVIHLGVAQPAEPLADIGARVAAHLPTWRDGQLLWQTPTGTRLAWAWTGPLRVDGVSEPHVPQLHVANDYVHAPLGTAVWHLHRGTDGLDLRFDGEQPG